MPSTPTPTTSPESTRSASANSKPVRITRKSSPGNSANPINNTTTNSAAASAEASVIGGAVANTNTNNNNIDNTNKNHSPQGGENNNNNNNQEKQQQQSVSNDNGRSAHSNDDNNTTPSQQQHEQQGPPPATASIMTNSTAVAGAHGGIASPITGSQNHHHHKTTGVAGVGAATKIIKAGANQHNNNNNNNNKHHPHHHQQPQPVHYYRRGIRPANYNNTNRNNNFFAAGTGRSRHFNYRNQQSHRSLSYNIGSTSAMDHQQNNNNRGASQSYTMMNIATSDQIPLYKYPEEVRTVRTAIESSTTLENSLRFHNESLVDHIHRILIRLENIAHPEPTGTHHNLLFKNKANGNRVIVQPWNNIQQYAPHPMQLLVHPNINNANILKHIRQLLRNDANHFIKVQQRQQEQQQQLVHQHHRNHNNSNNNSLHHQNSDLKMIGGLSGTRTQQGVSPSSLDHTPSLHSNDNNNNNNRKTNDRLDAQTLKKHQEQQQQQQQQQQNSAKKDTEKDKNNTNNIDENVKAESHTSAPPVMAETLTRKKGKLKSQNEQNDESESQEKDEKENNTNKEVTKDKVQKTTDDQEKADQKIEKKDATTNEEVKNTKNNSNDNTENNTHDQSASLMRQRQGSTSMNPSPGQHQQSSLVNVDSKRASFLSTNNHQQNHQLQHHEDPRNLAEVDYDFTYPPRPLLAHTFGSLPEAVAAQLRQCPALRLVPTQTYKPVLRLGRGAYGETWLVEARPHLKDQQKLQTQHNDELRRFKAAKDRIIRFRSGQLKKIASSIAQANDDSGQQQQQQNNPDLSQSNTNTINNNNSRTTHPNQLSTATNKMNSATSGGSGTNTNSNLGAYGTRVFQLETSASIQSKNQQLQNQAMNQALAAKESSNNNNNNNENAAAAGKDGAGKEGTTGNSSAQSPKESSSTAPAPPAANPFAAVQISNLASTGAIRLKNGYEIPAQHAFVCKVINRESSTFSQVANEVNILANVAHPNITAFVEGYVETGRMNLVMEYVDGGDLRKEIDERRSVPPGQTMKRYTPEGYIMTLFSQTCLGIEYLHRHNILHRDLKPENLIVSKKWLVKIADFGLAKRYDNDISVPIGTSFVGTPGYVASEIWQKKGFSEKVDVFALGCILYELITLDRAFPSHGMAKRDEIPEGLDTLDRRPITRMEISRDVKELCDWLLEPDPNNRPSMLELMRVPIVFNAAKDFVRNFMKSAGTDPVDRRWGEILEEQLNEIKLSSCTTTREMRIERRSMAANRMMTARSSYMNTRSQQLSRMGTMSRGGEKTTTKNGATGEGGRDKTRNTTNDYESDGFVELRRQQNNNNNDDDDDDDANNHHQTSDDDVNNNQNQKHPATRNNEIVG